MSKVPRYYKSTESKYKGGAQEMYVTYDLIQETRGDHHALYPKVTRVYIAGDVKDWHVGDFTKRTGKAVHGVKIDYEQSRGGYARKGYTAKRGGTEYQVQPTQIPAGKSHFSKIVEVPSDAQNVAFHQHNLPQRYQAALQDIR
ncbi:MAG TPA: hypothetical protein VHD90_11970 [Phototrophicaceae bacterium]|nr:hypothetical protein [Phototrophicaceae bacterium]